MSVPPGPSDRIQGAYQIEQGFTRLRRERLNRVSTIFRFDDSTFFEYRLGGSKSALPILVIDKGENARVFTRRDGTVSGKVGGNHRLDQLWNHGGAHVAGGASVEVGKQGNTFLAVEWPLDGAAAGVNQGAQLVRSARAFDLEQLDVLEIRRHVDE
jgi:hypothetical protein